MSLRIPQIPFAISFGGTGKSELSYLSLALQTGVITQSDYNAAKPFLTGYEVLHGNMFVNLGTTSANWANWPMVQTYAKGTSTTSCQTQGEPGLAAVVKAFTPLLMKNPTYMPISNRAVADVCGGGGSALA